MIFFYLFALFMMAYLVLCLWVFPNYLIYDRQQGTAGMIQPESEKVATSIDKSPPKEMNVGWILMISQMIGAICIVLLVGMQRKKMV